MEKKSNQGIKGQQAPQPHKLHLKQINQQINQQYGAYSQQLNINSIGQINSSYNQSSTSGQRVSTKTSSEQKANSAKVNNKLNGNKSPQNFMEAQQQQIEHSKQEIENNNSQNPKQFIRAALSTDDASPNTQKKLQQSSGSMFIKENTGNIKDFYKISSCIGRGAYGEVRKCLHKETKALRAVKIINKKYLADEQSTNLQKLLNEIDVLKQLDHPNILKLYEFFQDPKRYFLVTEFCNGGELFDKIAEEQYFSEQDAARLIQQILSAINYCHQRNIVHRDLKPENLLMNRDVKDPKITIIDFGTSGIFDQNQKMQQKFGTPYYIAPEVLNNNYDEKCDLWSIGVILYILLCGYPPFNGQNDEQIIKRVKEGRFRTDEEEWSSISPDAIDLINRLLTYNPAERITASEALQHTWIKKQSGLEIDQKVTIKALQNLRDFRGSSKLKQCALAFIASHLTQDDERQNLDKIFKAIDLNGDGDLSKEEVQLGYEKHFGIQMTDEQVDEMFAKIDLDGSGTIDYTEFMMATVNEQNLVTNERLLQAFKMFDKDSSGSLSYDEIKEVLCFDSSVDPQIVMSIIEEVDENGNGEIEFDEFCHMMQKLSTNKL